MSSYRTYTIAFTIVELIVAVSVFLILVAILVIGLGRIMSKAANVQDASNVRTLTGAIILYAAGNQMKIPANASPAEYDIRRNDVFVGVGKLFSEGFIDDLNSFYSKKGPFIANQSELSMIGDLNNLPPRLSMSYSYRDCARFSPRPSSIALQGIVGLIMTNNAGYYWNKPPEVNRDIYFVGYSDGSVMPFPREKLQVNGAIPNVLWWELNVDLENKR